jgi:hypothetical protein
MANVYTNVYRLYLNLNFYFLLLDFVVHCVDYALKSFEDGRLGESCDDIWLLTDSGEGGNDFLSTYKSILGVSE